MRAEREEWLARPADEARARRLRWVAWGLTAVVLVLVGLSFSGDWRSFIVSNSSLQRY